MFIVIHNIAVDNSAFVAFVITISVDIVVVVVVAAACAFVITIGVDIVIAAVFVIKVYLIMLVHMVLLFLLSY